MKDSFRLWPRVYERQPIDGGGAIFDGIVNSAELGTSAVTTAKIKDAAVTSDKVGSSAITEGKIKDRAISASKIQTNALGSIAIGTGAITSAELASSAVTQGKINDGAVNTAKLASNAVTNAKVDTNAAIAKSKVSSTGTWTAAEIPNLSATKITSDQLALARGGTGQDLSGKTVAVLEDAQTFTAQQTFDEDIETKGGISISKLLTKEFNYDATDDTRDPFTFSDITGTGTDNGVIDGIDNGRQIQTGATINNRSVLSLNDIRQFDPANCVVYGIFKRDSSDSYIAVGLSNNINPSTDESINVIDDTNQSFIRLTTVDGGSATVVATDVAVSTNNTPFKIVCSATDQKLFLLVSGEWTLKATQSTRLPTQKSQPFLDLLTRTSSAKTGQIIKLKVRNLS